MATALAGLTLADVQQASSFDAGPASAHTTIRTFDGLVVDLDGWTRNDKHYVSLKAAFDQALADQFKQPEAAAKDEKKEPAAKDSTKSEDKDAAKTTNVSEDANAINVRASGWIYEIPQYKYDAIFKPLEQLLKKQDK